MRRKMRRNEKTAQNWYLSFNFTNVSDYATIKHRTFGRAQDLRAFVYYKKSICVSQEKYLCITRRAFVYHKKKHLCITKKAFVPVNNESWKIHGEKLIYI